MRFQTLGPAQVCDHPSCLRRQLITLSLTILLTVALSPIPQAEPMEEDTDPALPASKSETELLEQLYEKYCGKDRIIDAFELYDILRELGAGLLKEDKPLRYKICLVNFGCWFAYVKILIWATK